MPRREPEVPVVAASAAVVRLRDENSQELSRRALRIGASLGWQIDAIENFDRLGFVWYSHTWRGRAIGGLHYLVGYRDESGEAQPLRNAEGRLHPEADEAIALAAEDALRRLVGKNGSTREWAEPLGTLLSLVAEAWVVGYHVNADGDPVEGLVDEGGFEVENEEAVAEIWETFSPTAIERKTDPDGNTRIAVTRTSGGDKALLPSDAVAVRIWQRHPQYPDDPSGAMAALNDVCDDVLVLRSSMRGAFLSRTHAGLLLVPSEGLGQPLAQVAAQVSGGGSDGAGPPPNPVLTEIIAGLSTPVRDPNSVAALVPAFISTKGDHIEKWRHIALTRDVDPAQKEQREELIRAYATGVDLPPERLLGMADLNHWTAWQVGEDSWRHVEPTARTGAEGLTAGYLWPSILDDLTDGVEDAPVDPVLRERIQRFVVMYDPTSVVDSSFKAEDADEAFDRGAISWSAYRRIKRIPEEDAPTSAELEERARLGYGRAPAPTQPGAQPGPAQSTPPGEARSVVRAAAVDDDALARVAARTGRIEVAFLREALLIVDGAVDEAVRKAQARLRSAAQRDPALRSLVAGVPLGRVASTLGPRAVRTLGATFASETDDETDGLFAGPLLLMAERFQALAAAAIAEWDAMIEEELGVDPFDEADEERVAGNVAAAGAVLVAGARLAAEQSLLGTATSAVAGEVPSVVRIPPVVVRRAAARAGGTPVGASLDLLSPSDTTGIVTGPEAVEALGRRGYRAAGLVWVYGSEASRQNPYEPHVELDGVEVERLDDFLGFFPGDHRGCQCATARLYEPIDGGGPGEADVLSDSELADA